MIEEKNFFKIDGKQFEQDQIEAAKQEGSYLVSASAGTGKTLTIIGKVKYLIKEKKVNPNEIIVLAFTDKVANELNERIKNELNSNENVNITTFHKFGLEIMRKAGLYSSIDSNGFNTFLLWLYKQEILIKDENKGQVFINGINKYSTEFCKEEIEILLKAFLSQTIDGQYIKDSINTIQVMNFLSLNNINSYSYQYGIVSIPKYGLCYRVAKSNYKADDTRNIIDVTDYEQIGCLNVVKKLYQDLISRNIKVQYEEENANIPMGSIYNYLTTYKEYYHIYRTSSNQYENIGKQINTAFNLIECSDAFEEDLLQLISNYDCLDRDERFLKMMILLQKEYYSYLNQNENIDFSKMITSPKEAMQKGLVNKSRFKYKYFIVDEYQDISKPRFEMLLEARKINDGYIIGFGDDWQSIYSFAGANNEYFLHFNKYVPNAIKEPLVIHKTYRINQEVADFGKKIIFDNNKNSYVDKTINSVKKADLPIVVLNYSVSNFDSFEYALDDIVRNSPEKQVSLMILGRTRYCYSFMINENNLIVPLNEKNKDNYDLYRIDNPKYKNIKIFFSSVHRAKGLEADYVFVACASKDQFPYKANNKTYINLLMKLNEFENEDLDAPEYHSYNNDDEERRLLYVALTRSKNNIYISSWQNKLSKFIEKHIEEKEIKVVNLEEHNNKWYNKECIQCKSCLRDAGKHKKICENGHWI